MSVLEPHQLETGTVVESLLGNEISRTDQALSDIKRAASSEVCLVRCDTRAEELEMLDWVARLARERGFVSAELSLRRSPLFELDQLLKTIIENLVAPTASGPNAKRGLAQLFQVFLAQHGKNAAAVLSEAAAEHAAAGDLTDLALCFMAGPPARRKTVLEELEQWLTGTSVDSSEKIARSALSARTARRVLTELTRLVKALGFSGCFFCLSEGDAIAHRTSAQRERTYILLRELIDNFDSDRGATSCRFVITGRKELFEGARSVRSLPPLLGRLSLVNDQGPPPPHRPWVTLTTNEGEKLVAFEPLTTANAKARAMRALIRISQGLPPTEAISDMSVGHERIDKVIDGLLEHASISGSVFTVLTGDYGSGKTHLLLHLAERALSEGHSVFRLDLERLNFDLGNPQRHLRRLLEDSTLPLRGRPSALDRAASFSRSKTQLRKIEKTLALIADEQSEASAAAAKLLRLWSATPNKGLVLEAFLGARDLETKPGSPNYRQDAYSRLLLWLELLARIDDCKGPVLIIDEGENLYTGGTPRAARRAALRSLSFYCGGALPNACVVIAITPRVLEDLKADSSELLDEVAEQRTLLPWEDASMLRQRLHRLRPQPVPEFTRAQRRELAERVLTLHNSVRGPCSDEQWELLVKRAAESGDSPRGLIRRLVDHLETQWWRVASQ